MKERPILFNDAMVRSILDGRKTQTRRGVKPGASQKWLSPETIDRVRRFAPSVDDWWTMAVGDPSSIVHCGREMDGGHIGSIRCPYGQPGDRLWVRETLEVSYQGSAYYAADMAPIADHDALGPLCDRYGHPYFFNELKGVPSIHMPRWASRITLEVVSVRVERLQDISEADAKAEGVSFGNTTDPATGEIDCDAGEAFEALWSSVYGAESWDANPWVWVVEFRRLP